jgi:ubiquinone/menaquinone biosynthesis C-methylase UbiE
MIKNAAASNPDMEFHISGCEKMVFKDSTMDAITVSAAYHHFPDVRAFAREARRILRPKGKIYIADIYVASILKVLLNPFVPLSSAGDVRFYSPKEIVNNFKRVGFEEIGVKIYNHIQIISMRK